ncbi:MAG TPA: UDP-N-acetylmuramate--L-alanine ligase [Ktedonobacteraceae bacterium]|nr:UDP-N-acetylmuramate--L-alanine ligase [Ktedonobacteraceae bacterium]
MKNLRNHSKMYARLHFMGIGGQGISSVAQMAQLAGNTVTGCDRQPSATTRMLEKAGIPVEIGHHVEHLQNADALVISPAVPALQPDNPELLGAQEANLPVFTWQELLGELTQEKCLFSVSGVHGKGTTTAMLSLMMVDGGLDPTCEIGAVVPRFGTNYRLGQSDYFVNEADEFNHNFWHYHPRVAVVTSIEFEHPEFFANYDVFLNAFEQFIRGMDRSDSWEIPTTLIVNTDSPGCLDLLKRLSDWKGRLITYSIEGMPSAAASGAVSALCEVAESYEAYNVKLDGETSFQVRTLSSKAFPEELTFQLGLPGTHNIQNALAALVTASVAGVPPQSIQQTLTSFSGIRRRFEIRQQGPLPIHREPRDLLLIDDYAHHPTAIAATLEAAHRRYPDRRVIAVYQPHMYSRTKTFFEQFVPAFDGADIAIITDIFPARERDTGLVSSRQVVEAIQAHRQQAQLPGEVVAGGDLRETTRILREILRDGDLVLLMGAGDIYTVTEALLHDGEL